MLLQSCDTLDTEAGFQEEPAKKKLPSNPRKFFQRKESRHKDKENGISERKKDSDDEVVIGRFEENNGGGRIRISESGSGFQEKNNGGERIRISGSGFEENNVEEGQAVSRVVPNGIYCTSLAFCQDCPETSLGGQCQVGPKGRQ